MTRRETDPVAATSRVSGWRRWAVAALPFVIAARALLLVVQIHTKHHPAPPPPLPTWPAQPGEELRFTPAALPALQRWAARSDRRPLAVAVLEKDGLAAAPGTGCILDPVSMARHGGGTLTLGGRDASGYRLAEWRGGATMPALADLPAAAGFDAEERRLQTAMLTAADCGGTAQLSLGDDMVHTLVDLLSGRTPEPYAARQTARRLVIPVEGPPPS